MKESTKEDTDVVAALDANRDMLQRVFILLEGLSERVEQVTTELDRIKESQNQLLAGLALQERVKRYKEDLLGLEVEPPVAEGSDLNNIEAFCNNCMKMVSIAEPVSTLKDGRLTVRGKCEACGTAVFRILS